MAKIKTKEHLLAYQQMLQKELFGTEENPESGFIVKLRLGKWDDEQYRKIYDLFALVHDEYENVDIWPFVGLASYVTEAISNDGQFADPKRNYATDGLIELQELFSEGLK